MIHVLRNGCIYSKLKKTSYDNTCEKCVVDSAFCGESHAFVRKSSQDCLSDGSNFKEMTILRQATSIRQSLEYGICALQTTFVRLKDPLTHEESRERKLILLMIALLFSLRADFVCKNQI